MKRTSIFLLLSILTWNGIQAQSSVNFVTNKSFARGATQAFTRATITAKSGATITAKGFCWSDNTNEPTIEDGHSTQYFKNSGNIYRLTDLTPATIYYARPYATLKDGTTLYGQAIKIVTLPKGTISWGYDNGGSSDENTRIRAAVESCVDYWNNLTNIDGLYLNVHYGAQTPTADCSYGGWMRVGPNASYQKTGTIMHEALHAIGVGQHDIWYGESSPLRAGSGTGQWLGDRATELIRFWDNNTTEIVNGDRTHVWPYGINGAQEDNGTEMLYTITSLLAQALGEDGLPCTNSRGFASPYYAFNQEDTIKYYIKNESETYGLKTSYLTESADGELVWKELSVNEADQNSNAAWYVTFTPGNQYYQIRNAETGHYISYGYSPAEGFCLANHSQPTSDDNLQLMRARVDVTSVTGELITPNRGYWLIHADKGTSTRNCLSASTNGGTSTVSFDLRNSASRQRWIILSTDEAKAVENHYLTEAKNRFDRLVKGCQEIMSTPYIELKEGASQQLTTALDTLPKRMEKVCGADDAQAITDALASALKSFLPSVCVADMQKPFDLTCLVENPDFESGLIGWEGMESATWASNVASFNETAVATYQTVEGMPKGTYSVTVQAFQRPGSYETVYANYDPSVATKALLYLKTASNAKTPILNIMAGKTIIKRTEDDIRLSDGYYIPNSCEGASEYFLAEAYKNEVTYFYDKASNVKFGITASNNNGSGYWLAFSNVRLHYYGPKTLSDIEAIQTGIEEIGEECTVNNRQYDLNGLSLQGQPHGLYIRNGRIILQK